MDSFAQFFCQHRLFFAILLSSISITAAVGLTKLQFDDELRNVYHMDTPVARELDRLFLDFGSDDSTCVILVEGEDLLLKDGIDSLWELRESLSEISGVEWISSVLDARSDKRGFIRNVPLLLFPQGKSDELYAEAAESALRDPWLAGRLLSEDGHATVMLVKLEDNRTHIQDLARIVTQIRETARNSLEGTNLTAGLTGIPVLRVAVVRALQRDNLIFNVAGPVLGICMAFFFFRRPAAVLIVMSGPILGVIWSLGFMAWAGEPLNVFNTIVAPLALTIGFTNAVHLMHHVRRHVTEGELPLEAARSAIRLLGVACALTSLTTAIGFASLLTAEVDIVGRNGLICAISVILTFVAVIISVPLLASTRLGSLVSLPLARQKQRGVIGAAERLLYSVLNFPKLTTFAGIVACAGLLAVAVQLRPQIRLSDHLPRSSDALATLKSFDDEFGGPFPVVAVVEWAEGHSFSSKESAQEILSVLSDVHEIFAAEPELSRPASLYTLLQSLSPDVNEPTRGLADLRSIPDDRLQRLVRTDLRRAVVLAHVRDVGSQTTRPVFGRVEKALEKLQQENPGYRIALTGSAVVHSMAGDLIVGDLFSSLRTATIVIFAILTLVFRSFRLGLLSLLPNIFPLVAAAAMMVFTDLPLQFSTVNVFCIGLGIAVDDTIHFLVRYQHEQSSGHKVNSAIFHAFHKVGGALITTTAVMIVGFGVVLLSDVTSLRLFGILICSMLAFALFGDLILLPAELAWFRPAARRAILMPHD